MRLRTRMSASRKVAASSVSESRATRSGSRTSRTTYRRSVADNRSPTGGQRRRESRGTAEHPGLHERVLRVQLAVGRGEQPLDDTAVLGLAGGHRQPAESARSVEVGDARALEEDLLDVAPCEQLGERAEVGDRSQQLLDDGVGIGERPGLAEVGPLLVGGDRLAHLGPHLLRVGVGAQPSAFESVEHVGADRVVRAAGGSNLSRDRHDRPPRRRRARRRPVSPASRAASTATDRAKGPSPTTTPSQAASPTRGSSGSTWTDEMPSSAPTSARNSATRNRSCGARFTTTCLCWRGVPASSPSAPAARQRRAAWAQ